MRGSGEDEAGLKARRILAQRFVDEGVSVATVAKAFGTTEQTIYNDLEKNKEAKAASAIRTLEKALDENPSPAAPYVKDLLRLASRIPAGSE